MVGKETVVTSVPKVSTTCPRCRQRAVLIPDEILLRLDDADAHGRASIAFVCPMCGDLASRPVDERGTDLLQLAGVAPLQDREPHPELPPQGPTLTADDVLDLHLLLRRDGWLADLLETPTDRRRRDR